MPVGGGGGGAHSLYGGQRVRTEDTRAGRRSGLMGERLRGDRREDRKKPARLSCGYDKHMKQARAF